MPLWPIGLRGKGLNKLRATFEGIYILIFLILDSAFEYMIVLSCAYNSYIPGPEQSMKSIIDGNR